MNNFSFENIVITDSDIDEVESLLGNVKFDETRRNIIKNLERIDVQACPGSGKTTVLVAKLAILAKKWNTNTFGICVLSHTNVARQEIEKRLGQTDVGQKLLSYPHYIGTIHGFFDSFVALPWLRSNGYKITLIDTETAIGMRWRKLQFKAKSFLERKHFDEYSLQAVKFPISFDIACSENTDTYKNVKNTVNQNQRDGYFTYDEMLYVSQYALVQHPSISKAIKKRFPIMFIDEVQDTAQIQLQLLASAFGEESIRQTFGDSNQAIYNSINAKNSTNVVHNNALFIKDSHRFGQSIAKLSNPFAVNSPVMTGKLLNYAKNDCNNTVFLFDKNNTQKVLDEYAKLILNCFTDAEMNSDDSLECFAVGMVHNAEPEDSTRPQFPRSVKDYWNSYEPNKIQKKDSFDYLIDYFREAQDSLNSKRDVFSYIENISKSFIKIINESVTARISTRGVSFHALLATLSVDNQQKFRKEMLSLITLPFENEGEWKVVTQKCCAILRNYFNVTKFDTKFFQWQEASFSSTDKENEIALAKNTYYYEDNQTGRSVKIRLASIHAVKGQTHLATLLLETYWHDHNIKSVLSALYGQYPPKGVRNEMRKKCNYVALTRARGLICVALPREFVSNDEIKLIQNHGWNVKLI